MAIIMADFYSGRQSLKAGKKQGVLFRDCIQALMRILVAATRIALTMLLFTFWLNTSSATATEPTSAKMDTNTNSDTNKKQPQQTEEHVTEEKETTDQPSEENNLRFSIPATGKKISAAEIMAAISKEVGIEMKYPLGKRDQMQIELDSIRARLAIIGLNYALNPAIDIKIAAGATSLSVVVDKSALRRQFATFFAGEPGNLWTPEMGLHLDDPKVDLTTKKRLVILIHGFNSEATGFKSLIEEIKRTDTKQSHQVAIFQYPSQAGIIEVTERLRTDLAKALRKNQDLKVSLVTHSMGGIVARQLIEKTDRESKNIDRLIMVTPPNHGSELARSGMTGDVLEALLVKVDRRKLSELVLGAVASINQSAGDMLPNSKVLADLNKQTRNPNVRYSILLGNRSFLKAEQAEFLKTTLKKVNIGTTKMLADSLEQLRGELITGSGDGVVSLESGRLEGVKDVQVLPFSHNDILDSNNETQKTIIQAVIKQLELPGK